MKSTGFQAPNNKQFPNNKIQISNNNCFGHWNSGFICDLGFGAWSV
jgi:hypothetical protein